MLIGYDNIVQSGALSFNSEAPALPGSNVALNTGEPHWQAAPGIGVTSGAAIMDIDAGTDTQWRAFGLFRTNLDSNCAVTFSLGTTLGGNDVYSAIVYDCVAGYGQVVHVADATYSARYCRATITNQRNPDGVIKIGMVYAGPAAVLEYGAEGGLVSAWTTNDVTTTTRGGQEYTVRSFRKRSVSFSLPIVDDALLHGTLNGMAQKMAAGRNVLVVPNVSSDYILREAIFGRDRSGLSATYSDYWRRPVRLNIEERL